MPDLIVIQLMPGVMAENLEKSLSQAGRHPWAFNKFLSTMNGIQPDVNVVFMQVATPGGKGVGRSGPYPPDSVVHRFVLGTIQVPISETATPFFDGFPHEFWFDLIEDLEADPPVGLAGACDILNERLPGLALDDKRLLRVLSNGRSAKLGMFFDGEPRRADYFKHLTNPSTRESAPRGPSPSPATTRTIVALSGLEAAVGAFEEAVGESGLVFAGINSHLPKAFLSALMAKRFVLLTGLSGSGKTQIARSFGQWLGSDSQGPGHLVVPVRADWTTPEPLLGYEDALMPPSGSSRARAWSVPPALEFILRAHRSPERLFVLILDEMNLAHVERYFADVLSGMESGEPIVPNLSKDSGTYWYPVEGEPQLVPLPTNLFVVGTVNIDETTYQFSPKVLDRSFSFEFRVSTDELDGALGQLAATRAGGAGDLALIREVTSDPDWHLSNPADAQDEVEALLIDLHAQLSVIGLEFGHRTYREALRLASVLSAAGLDDSGDLADWVIMTKVLPRVHGPRRQLEPFLRSLIERSQGEEPEKPDLPLVARKAKRMLESLIANQYAGFAE